MMKSTHNKLGLGTAAIGRPLYINIKQEGADKDVSQETFTRKGMKMLEAAYVQGVRYFDTAPGYGVAEQMLIDWAGEKDDETLEIATKWGYTYVANFDSKATEHEVKEHSLSKLNAQWDKSKSLLPLLTTYQIHSATLETGVLDNNKILHRLAELKDNHDLHIGITTTGANQLEVLKKAMDLEVNGKELFDVFQVTYNIYEQDLATVAADIARRNKRLIVKEALANGRIFPNDRYPHYAKAFKYLTQLSQKYNVGVDAIALRFCMDTIPVHSVLSGAANRKQLSENMKILDFKLEEIDIVALKEVGITPHDYWNERKNLSWN